MCGGTVLQVGDNQFLHITITLSISPKPIRPENAKFREQKMLRVVNSLFKYHTRFASSMPAPQTNPEVLYTGVRWNYFACILTFLITLSTLDLVAFYQQ